MKSLSDKYCEGLQELERYCEYIIEFSDYATEDIVHVRADLGNHRMCDMVVCPKSCVISGVGILKPDYFIGLEEIKDEKDLFVGWNIIFEVPHTLKINNTGRL